MNEIKEYTKKVFEDIKHIDNNGNEYWYARELQNILEYTQWRRFENVINKAKIACKNSNIKVDDHFANVGKMVDIGSNAKRITKDYRLTRYACYLIAQNGDSRKEVIALAQTYFAIQTRKQELSEKEYNELTEDEKRLYRRNQARKGNYNLNKTAVKSGVKDLARFHNAGYKGLYNGETADDIFKRKKLRYREDILDNMGSEELADNIFRIAQTDAKLKRDNVDNEYKANYVHYEVGKEIRNSIKRLGGTMPENLSTPYKSLKELEKENTFVLRISDYNTSGLSDPYTQSNDPFNFSFDGWNALIKIDGGANKGDDKAGAFGIGKSAPFSNSYYRLIFYRTYNQKYERAAQGISRLMSYQNGALMTSGIGYYGEAEGNNPVEAIPELDSINKRLKIGTDVFIYGFKSTSNWETEITVALLENFLISF